MFNFNPLSQSQRLIEKGNQSVNSNYVKQEKEKQRQLEQQKKQEQEREKQRQLEEKIQKYNRHLNFEEKEHIIKSINTPVFHVLPLSYFFYLLEKIKLPELPDNKFIFIFFGLFLGYSVQKIFKILLNETAMRRTWIQMKKELKNIHKKMKNDESIAKRVYMTIKQFLSSTDKETIKTYNTNLDNCLNELKNFLKICVKYDLLHLSESDLEKIKFKPVHKPIGESVQSQTKSEIESLTQPQTQPQTESETKSENISNKFDNLKKLFETHDNKKLKKEIQQLQDLKLYSTQSVEDVKIYDDNNIFDQLIGNIDNMIFDDDKIVKIGSIVLLIKDKFKKHKLNNATNKEYLESLRKIKNYLLELVNNVRTLKWDKHTLQFYLIINDLFYFVNDPNDLINKKNSD
jgi:hypothetical protein